MGGCGLIQCRAAAQQQPRFLSRQQEEKEISALTRYLMLRVVHTRHDRHEAMVMGDEPGHYRPYAHIPPCENRTATNALADLFTAAPELIALLEEKSVSRQLRDQQRIL